MFVEALVEMSEEVDAGFPCLYTHIIISNSHSKY